MKEESFSFLFLKKRQHMNNMNNRTNMKVDPLDYKPLSPPQWYH